MCRVNAKIETLVKLSTFLAAIFILPLVHAEEALVTKALPPMEFPAEFPMEEELLPRVRFWVNIYTLYDSKKTVVHNDKYPEIVYTVIDTEKNPHSFLKVKRHYIHILNNLASKQQRLESGALKPEKLPKEEFEVYQLYAKIHAPEKFAEAADPKHVHGQSGLKDTFAESLFISGRYLPRMLKVFENFGLPADLAYLPFVESGFHSVVRSTVGAAGMWQFMPYTGKLFLRVDEVVDERNDPMRAAEAAARLMKQNFDFLKDWPLAITAYNHGANGIANATRVVGTRSIASIIRHYDGKSFGFASENYYASFLGAIYVAKNADYFLQNTARAKKLEFDEFVMPDFIDQKDFVSNMGIKAEDFRELNPALTDLVYTGLRYIPVGYTVRVPVESREDFLTKYEKIPAILKHDEQKIDVASADEALQ